MRINKIPLLAAATVATAAVVLALSLSNRENAAAGAFQVGALLSAGRAAPGFRRAVVPMPFHFPADHGAHPEFRSEWWYFTGNLAGPDGRPFGFQLTFFRYALTPDVVSGGSAWRARQVYMAHFAVSDIAEQRFRSFERLSRAALGLAGTRSDPPEVWLEDWSARFSPDSAAWRLSAEEEGYALELRLRAEKPPVLQGEDGLSRKSPAPGNASYYYSMPRLRADGALTVNGVRYPVAGQAWLDREWSTSALGTEQVGWDWFALQLDNGTELMYYALRRRDGGIDPLSAGSLVDVSGRRSTLKFDEVEIEVIRYWTSPASGRRYPAGWRFRVPGASLDLRIRPRLADQELRHSVRYWEGAVSVEGTARSAPVGGVGYVELTGY